MFTDMVGYTALMQENEREAHQKRQRHREILKEKHEAFRGEILQYYGDGTLSIFKSAVYAVKCGIEMQKAFQLEPKVPLRIGIHIGDVVHDDEGIFGDGVNIASRIESMGVSGSILISHKLKQELLNQPEILLKELGSYDFKNVKEPQELFAIANPGLVVPAKKDMKGKLKESLTSVAVLPFKNMSADPENEYFSDGITEEILNVLARIEGLKVTARTSSFAFKNVEIDIREIGKQLGVSTLLEGSVRKAGNKVRITAQLINAADGYHFWSETYDRDLEDIFAVQDEVSAKIAEKLRQSFSPETRKGVASTQKVENLDAYNEYLLALHLMNNFDRNSGDKVLAHLQKAIELEPNYAQAYAHLSLVYGRMITSRLIKPALAIPKMLDAAEKALSYSKDLPEAYTALMRIRLFHDWNWEGTSELVDKMQDLHPQYPWTLHGNGFREILRGNYEKANESLHQALERDPLNPFRQQMLMWIQFIMGNYEKVIEQAKHLFERVPNFRPAIELKGWALCELGKYEEALEVLENLKPMLGFRYHKLASIGYCHAKSGNREEAEACLEKIQEEFQFGLKKGSNVFLALIYTALGEIPKAIQHLATAIDQKEGDVFFFFRMPQFAPLKESPLFPDLLEKFNFPESWLDQ